MGTMDRLLQTVRDVRAGTGHPLVCVCSAHRDVISAALVVVARHGDLMLAIEATGNQVNQSGGYSGMMPGDFAALVRRTGRALDIPDGQIVLGGDHLGPRPWCHEPPEVAMAHARDLVAGYVAAGFTKIHLDCSQGCAGEPAAPDDGTIAARTAELARIAEQNAPDRARLCYIIGSEVPPPGGAGEMLDDTPAPSEREAAAQTLAVHRAAFRASGLDAAWGRVRGLVVQPGLEFGARNVAHFDASRPDRLSPVLKPFAHIAFEAHSTDYQSPATYRALARRNFAFLKVGPALTFACREAIYALSHIRIWLEGGAHISALLEQAMQAHPAYWQNHYHGTRQAQYTLRHFSHADRIRYYWSRPEITAAVSELEAAINAAAPPATLVQQYFSAQDTDMAAVLRAQGHTVSQSLILAHIGAALEQYLMPGPGAPCRGQTV